MSNPLVEIMETWPVDLVRQYSASNADEWRFGYKD